jgi:hypothetical protein
VFENSARRKILGPKRDEVTGDWRRLHKQELYNMYSSRNIIQAMKNEMSHTSGMYENRRGSYRFFVRDMGEKGHLKDLGVDGKIILKWIFRSGLGR